MNTRNKNLGMNPAWVALGACIIAGSASAQMRRHPGNLTIGHSEQGRTSGSGTQSTGHGATDGFRLTYGGDEGGKGTSFGGTADVEFRKSADSRFVDTSGLPPTRDGGWIVLYADGAERTSAAGVFDRPRGSNVPAPGALVVLGLGGLAAARRRRPGI